MARPNQGLDESQVPGRQHANCHEPWMARRSRHDSGAYERAASRLTARSPRSAPSVGHRRYYRHEIEALLHDESTDHDPHA